MLPWVGDLGYGSFCRGLELVLIDSTKKNLGLEEESRAKVNSLKEKVKDTNKEPWMQSIWLIPLIHPLTISTQVCLIA